MVAEVGQQENGNRADATSGASYQHCAITRGHQLGLQSLHIKKMQLYKSYLQFLLINRRKMTT
jgi:hypothetical protein